MPKHGSELGAFSRGSAPTCAVLENQVSILPLDTWFYQVLVVGGPSRNEKSDFTCFTCCHCLKGFWPSSSDLKCSQLTSLVRQGVSGRLWSRRPLQGPYSFVDLPLTHKGSEPWFVEGCWKYFSLKPIRSYQNYSFNSMGLNNMGIWPHGSERLFPAGCILELLQFSCMVEWDAINMYRMFT